MIVRELMFLDSFGVGQTARTVVIVSSTESYDRVGLISSSTVVPCGITSMGPCTMYFRNSMNALVANEFETIFIDLNTAPFALAGGASKKSMMIF
jgi:hypothetical protein